MTATLPSRRVLRDPRQENGDLPASAVDGCMTAAATLIEALHCHGVHHMTVHSARGVHRIAVTQISPDLPVAVRGRLTGRLPGL